MPDTRGRPLPSEILPVLKDPSITGWLRNFIINLGSAASIGRVPGFESAQNDQYVYPDDADSTHPYNFDYVIPSNFQRLVSAKLSFKIRAYRTYSTFTPGSTTGGESVTHNHSLQPQNIAGAGTVAWNNSSPGILAVTNLAPNADTTSIQSNTVDHTHTMSGSSVLGISEDSAPVNPGITVKVDGTDVTSKVGGPFNNDMVEVDVTQVLKTPIKLWHTLSLQPNQRVRITGILRISYYIDSRLAQ